MEWDGAPLGAGLITGGARHGALLITAGDIHTVVGIHPTIATGAGVAAFIRPITAIGAGEMCAIQIQKTTDMVREGSIIHPQFTEAAAAVG